jgi:hypothetical protein
LDACLNEIKSQIAFKLFSVIVHHLRLKDYFRLFRDFALLSFGAFWNCFLVELDECVIPLQIDSIPVVIAERDLNIGPFKNAAIRLENENTKSITDKVHLQFSLIKFSTRRKSIDVQQLMVVDGDCHKRDLILAFEFNQANKHQNSRNNISNRSNVNSNRNNNRNIGFGHCFMHKKIPVEFGFSSKLMFNAHAQLESFVVVLEHDRIDWWLTHDHKRDLFGADICLNSICVGMQNLKCKNSKSDNIISSDTDDDRKQKQKQKHKHLKTFSAYVYIPSIRMQTKS